MLRRDGARLAAMKRRNRDGTAEWFTSFFDAAYVAQLREENPPAQTSREVDFLLRALRPAPGARILEVPCGTGRGAAALAGRGFQVVGVDLSRAMIAEARRRFAGRPRLTFVRGDMRRITFDREFDAVVNLYTSFGYFTPAQNQAVLRRLARALRPGGTLLVDHRDPVYDATLPRRPWYRAGATRFILEDRRFDRRTPITESSQLVIAPRSRPVRPRRPRFPQFSPVQWRRSLPPGRPRLPPPHP